MRTRRPSDIARRERKLYAPDRDRDADAELEDYEPDGFAGRPLHFVAGQPEELLHDVFRALGHQASWQKTLSAQITMVVPGRSWWMQPTMHSLGGVARRGPQLGREQMHALRLEAASKFASVYGNACGRG